MIEKNILHEFIRKRYALDSSIEDISALGMVDSSQSGTLSFIEEEKYLHAAISNRSISAILINKDRIDISNLGRLGLLYIHATEPKVDFFSLQNEITDYHKKHNRSVNSIHESCIIHPSAIICDHNVVLGENVIIEPNVTILSDVIIGANSYISSGSVIGTEGFEHKRLKSGILSVKHDGKVVIGERVFIGALNGISRGYSYRDTIIGDDTKTDNLVHISHGVRIGKRCLIPASSMIAGSVTIGDDVYIGPNSSISNRIQIQERGYVSIGSVVTRNVGMDQVVTGNFAVPHSQFLKSFKNLLKL